MLHSARSALCIALHPARPDLRLSPMQVFQRTIDFRLKRYVVGLYVGTFLAFLVVKGGLRRVLAGHEIPAWLEVVLYSFPNTAEAIIGMTNVAGLLFVARSILRPRFDAVPDWAISLLAMVLAGIYVISQEVKLHNLGGANVYDPYDVAASLLGLAVTFGLFWRVGVIDKRPPPAEPSASPIP